MAKWEIEVKLTNANKTIEIEHLETRTTDNITERQVITQLKKQLLCGFVQKVEIQKIVRISQADELKTIEAIR